MALKKIKKGDNIIMLTGKDKGKSGPVLEVRSDGRVVVDKLNLVKKHSRPHRQGEKGQVIEIPRPVNSSNVMLICKSCQKPARVMSGDQADKKIRLCKKCKAII